jgi:hypothetical protein
VGVGPAAWAARAFVLPVESLSLLERQVAPSLSSNQTQRSGGQVSIAPPSLPRGGGSSLPLGSNYVPLPLVLPGQPADQPLPLLITSLTFPFPVCATEPPQGCVHTASAASRQC